jgi:hypothetical protein
LAAPSTLRGPVIPTIKQIDLTKNIQKPIPVAMLKLNEIGKKNAHVIENHVPAAQGGQFATAQDRLLKNSAVHASGMFTSFAVTEKATAAVITANQAEFNKWFSDPKSTVKITLQGRASTPVGETCTRNYDGTIQTAPAHGVKMVIIKDAQVHGGCYIETAYPTR